MVLFSLRDLLNLTVIELSPLIFTFEEKFS